jgi:uncharacterized protein YbjQ (UPF0145 family)
MILTTTNSVEEYRILEYNGIVSGTAVNMQKMGLTFNMQKYYAGISESISDVKDQAFANLKENAEKMNANAVVGIHVDVYAAPQKTYNFLCEFKIGLKTLN